MSIYIYKNEQQQGPFEDNEIHDGLATGRFSLEDFAFKEGCSDWVALRTIYSPSKPPVLDPKNVQPATKKKTDPFGDSVDELIGDDQDPAVVSRIVKQAKELLELV